jgi:hypothetical protein
MVRLAGQNHIGVVPSWERPMSLGLAERQGDLLDDVVRFCLRSRRIAGSCAARDGITGHGRTPLRDVGDTELP